MRNHIILLVAVVLSWRPAACDDNEEEEQFEAFAEELADFIPSEAFEFELEPAEVQPFMYWPPSDTTKLRGMFYVTSEETEGLYVDCLMGGAVQKSFQDKKIGVFSIPFDGEGEIRLVFQSETKQLKVYLSYQYVLGREKKSHTPPDVPARSNASAHPDIPVRPPKPEHESDLE
jgi:hypothetical protein